MSEKLDLVINLPGGIPRLPLHIGALKAWHELGFPKPDEIISGSAGAMAGSAIIGWSEETFDKAARVIGNLTPGHIFSFRGGLKAKLAALGLATIGLGVLVLLDHKISKTKKAVLGLSGLASLLAIDILVGNELVHSESHLSPAPLKKLLEKELDFKAIFNSPIRLGVLVADTRKPGGVIFYNTDSRNSNNKNQQHRERWIRILLASSRLPGKFPFINIDGIDTVDGEVWTDFPIRQMKRFRKVVRFDFWPLLRTEPAPKEWISDLSRSFDIMRDRCTQMKVENYEFERQANPSLPAIYYVRLDDDLMALTPPIKIHDFTSEQMRISENIGYESVIRQKSDIRQYLES